MDWRTTLQICKLRKDSGENQADLLVMTTF